MAEIARIGSDAWLSSQLDPASIPDPVGDRIRDLFPEMSRNIAETRAAQKQFAWDSMFALGYGTLALATWSSRQLFEVMVDFWSNHLNVTCPSDGVWDNRADYDARVIRAHALGKFSDMLAESAVHPAMLNYLDNRSSTKTRPNENYGRELLELHTVGIGNYTEAEVLDSARIMTGWTTDSTTHLAIYRSGKHYVGAVRVLDFQHANASSNGQTVASNYLSYLAHHPLTASRLARKLCVRFVSDDPPADLVERLASTYLANDTEIKPVLVELFQSSAFWDARGAKVRRPLEDFVATTRTMGHTLLPSSSGTDAARKGVQAMYWMTNDAQQAPLAWTLPTGYPDVASAWASADMALGKINAHRSIGEGWWPNKSKLTVVTPQSLLPNPLPTTATYGYLIDKLSVRLVGDVLPAHSRSVIATFFGKSVNSTVGTHDDVRSWRAGALVSLILNSGMHAVR